MISKELAKKIRYLQLYTSKAVNDSLAGEYASVFKGRGMEFDEVREYQLGDEVRSIDWNVTARMGHPYVKRFVEERELTVMFLVDLSASGSFGSTQRIKNEVAAELCALVAFSAIKNNDKVGLIVFTDEVEMFVPPGKGASHVLRLIENLLTFKPKQSKTDIAGALEYMGKTMKKRSVVFLVSDFFGEGYEQPLNVLNKRHDVIAVSVTDPREVSLPNVGLIELEDAESGERVIVDTGSAEVRRKYKGASAARAGKLQELMRSMGIDLIKVFTDQDYMRDLLTFFRTRERRAQAGR